MLRLKQDAARILAAGEGQEMRKLHISKVEMIADYFFYASK